jgi:hypothetical protein
MTQKSWKTLGYIIDFKNVSRCVFFPEKGAMSNFFSEKGAVGQKRLGTCGLDNRLTVSFEILATCSSTYSPVRTSQEAHAISIK